MITGWILVLVMNGVYQTKHITMQEFNTKENCELVLLEISRIEKPVIGICAEK